MSDHRTGRTPANDAEMIRSLVQRIEALEGKQTLRLGDWVQGTDDAGRVVLTHTDGRQVPMTPDPEPESIERGEAALTGTCARISRHAAGNWSMPGVGSTPTAIPTSVFDSLDYQSSDFPNVDITAGTFKVPSEGQYLVMMGIWLSAGMGSPRIWPVVFLDNAVYATGSDHGSSAQAIAGQWVVHAEKDQVIKCGRVNSSTEVGIGDALGSLTYITVNRLP